MKILLLLLLLSTQAYAESYLILNFDNYSQKKEWAQWYLDRGGEDNSNFYVKDWNWKVWQMKKDYRYENEAASLLLQKMSFKVRHICF